MEQASVHSMTLTGCKTKLSGFTLNVVGTKYIISNGFIRHHCYVSGQRLCSKSLYSTLATAGLQSMERIIRKWKAVHFLIDYGLFLMRELTQCNLSLLHSNVKIPVNVLYTFNVVKTLWWKKKRKKVSKQSVKETIMELLNDWLCLYV